VPLSLANLIVVPLADRVAKDAFGLRSGSWPWALWMLALNVVMLLVALSLIGSAGRRARQVEEAPSAHAHEEQEHLHEQEDHAAHGETVSATAH
jgi:hypothetical protein